VTETVDLRSAFFVDFGSPKAFSAIMGTMSTLQIDFPGGGCASAVEISNVDELPSALGILGLQAPQPTVVVVGGAGGLTEDDLDRLRPVFSSAIVPEVQRNRAALIDGGTLSGVMRLCGEGRASLSASFPLVGVVAAGTVQLPGRPTAPDSAELEPRHSHFVIVPGDNWGAEAPWIARAASVLAGTSPSVTVLVNGGQIAYDDVSNSVAAGRRVIVVSGSGRTADAIADALNGVDSNERALDLAASGLVSSVSVGQPAVLAAKLATILGEQI
jgi:hypothetical protein